MYDPAMPNYRRWHTGRFVFLTVVTAERRAFLCGDLARRLLREAMAAAHAKWPWRTRGLVLLPNHLHLLWELPADDLDYSKRVGRWKSRFTTAWLSAGASEAEVPTGQRRRRLRGVWQQRFFEHTIRSVRDYQMHLDYIHVNPVKHGLVERPVDWQWSTFHRYVREGVYAPDWCGRTDLPGSVEYTWLE